MRGDDPWAAISDPWSEGVSTGEQNASQIDLGGSAPRGIPATGAPVEVPQEASEAPQLAPMDWRPITELAAPHPATESQQQGIAQLNAMDAPGKAMGFLTEGFGTHAAGLDPVSYRISPDGFIYVKYSDGTEDVRAMDGYADSVQWRQRYFQQYGEESPIAIDIVGGRAATEEEQNALDRKNDVLPESVDAFARGGALGLDDEIDAAVSSVIHGGSFKENLLRARRIRDYDEQNHPVERTLGTVAGSLALPTKGMGAAKASAAMAFRDSMAASLAAGVDRATASTLARSAAQSAARRAIVRQLTKEGAAYGGGIGAADADGGVGDRLAGGAIGALEGGAGGAALGAAGTQAARLLPRGGAAAGAEGRQVAQAAVRQGIDLLPADVGGPVTRRATSMTAQTIVGGQPIIKAAERMTDQAAAARDRISATFGQALDREAAGQEGIAGAKAYRASSRDEARAFYGQAEKATEGFTATPTKALEVLDRHIAELSETPGGAEGLKTLQQIRDDLSNGRTSVRGIRAMRTALRDQFASSGLRGSDIERRVGEVVDAASTDVADSLRAAGKGDAALLFAKGDQAWRTRAETIDNVLEPIIGTRANPRSGEQVIKTLTADLQGNNARAVKFLRAMPPGEQGNIRASIIGALGRSQAGQRSAEGEGFSLPIFLKNWNDIGETAKAAYFGPEARAALNDLAKVAKGAVEAQGYANRSNTGGAVGNILTLMTGLGGVATFGKTLAVQYGLGRLLASPRFARWLARSPRTSLSAPAYIDRLSRIAHAEPSIAGDVLGLQRRLMDAFNAGGPARIAADERSDKTGGVAVQQQEDEYANISEPAP